MQMRSYRTVARGTKFWDEPLKVDTVKSPSAKLPQMGNAQRYTRNMKKRDPILLAQVYFESLPILNEHNLPVNIKQQPKKLL